MVTSSPTTTRLADLLGTLSLSTDLAAGVPMETSLRTCLVAVRVARALGLAEDAVADVYYAALLRHLGCTGFAHETAAVAAGDDHDFLRTFEAIAPGDRAAAASQAVRSLARGAGPLTRATAIGRVLLSPSISSALAAAQCEQASSLAADFGMRPAVIRALEQIYERYDSAGKPRGLGGDAIELCARILHVGNLVEVQHRYGGQLRTLDAVRACRGGQLDPRVADAFFSEATAVWPLLSPRSVWESFLEAEPAPPRLLHAAEREIVALAFARYADLKVPSMLGHSPTVAELACKAAVEDGLAASEIETLRAAALLHDIGVVGVPNGVWEKQQPLNVIEWEQVRRHAYDTERILSRLPSLTDVAAVACAHHVRSDGSGYPRGFTVPPSARAARLLACADVYAAMTAARPHRPALGAVAAANELRREAVAGRLCARATDCVLAAVGRARSTERRPPPELTLREVEVLVELARGGTNKEIAIALRIAPRTVKHHLENIYEKINVTTRSAAALFAVRHGVVDM